MGIDANYYTVSYSNMRALRDMYMLIFPKKFYCKITIYTQTLNSLKQMQMLISLLSSNYRKVVLRLKEINSSSPISLDHLAIALPSHFGSTLSLTLMLNITTSLLCRTKTKKQSISFLSKTTNFLLLLTAMNMKDPLLLSNGFRSLSIPMV